MKIIPLPETMYLRKCLRYSRKTGELVWRHRPLSRFVSVRGWKRWNTRYADKIAFTATNKKGYRCGAIDKRLYLAHRVIWKLVTEEEPVCLIDHRDGVGGNNRWKNLRPASNGQNKINCEQVTVYASGRVGVFFRYGKWRAYIRENGRQHHLGVFVKKEDAVAVRHAAAKKYFGEYAR